MKRIALLAALAALSTSSVLAADLGIVNTAAPASYTESSAFNWTGFYAGANGGYGWAEIEDAGLTFDELDGWFGGVQAGYNHDFGGFVLGVEGDIQLADIGYSEELVPGITSEIGIDAFGTLRARAGVAADRFMPYVTGGLAWARGSVSVSGGGVSIEAEDDYVGFTIGAGLEAAVTDNVTIKAEYLYADFGDADFDTGVDIGLTSHIVRVGLNYKF